MYKQKFSELRLNEKVPSILCMMMIVIASAAGEDHVIRSSLNQHRVVSTELLKQARSHPYLFFTTEDIFNLRKLAEQDPYKSCAERIIRTANRVFDNPLPDEPDGGALHPRPGYKNNFDDPLIQIPSRNFLSASYLIEHHGPLFAFAYLLTGNDKYAERAKQWVLHYAKWNGWGPAGKKTDHFQGMILTAIVTVYDWIYDFFTKEERAQVLVTIHKIGHSLLWNQNIPADFINQPIGSNRASMSGNHRWGTIPNLGIAGLGVLYEEAEARDWLDWSLVIVRDYMLPATFGIDGERPEMLGWLRHSLFHGGLFMEALLRNGGPDLFRHHEGLKHLSHFLVYGMDMKPGNIQNDSFLLLFAKRLNDPLMQWLTSPISNNSGNYSLPGHHRWYDRFSVTEYEPCTWYDITLNWDAPKGIMHIYINGQIKDLQDIIGCTGIDQISVSDTHTGFEVEFLEVLDPAGNLITSLKTPKYFLRTGEKVDLVFKSLSSGWLKTRVRRGMHDKGDVAIILSSDQHRIRGIGFTWYQDYPEIGKLPRIVKMVEELEDFYTLGMAAYADLDFDAPWKFLFFDPGIESTGPRSDTHSFLYRDVGLVRMNDNLSDDKVSVIFYSGPEMTKEKWNKNAFELQAYGSPVLGGYWNNGMGPYAWSTIMIDGEGQMREGIKSEANIQWLGDNSIKKNGTIKEVFFSDDYDYVCGEADYAYRPTLEQYQRQILFFKSRLLPEYRFLIIVDDIVISEDVSRKVEWRLMAVPNVKWTSCDNVSVIDASTCKVYVHHLFPKSNALLIEKSDSLLEGQNIYYAAIPAQDSIGHVQYLHTIQPIRKWNEGERTKDMENISFDLLNGKNGIGVQFTGMKLKGLALFSKDQTRTSISNIETDGRCCLISDFLTGGRLFVLHDGSFICESKNLIFQSTCPASFAFRLEDDVSIRLFMTRPGNVTFAIPTPVSRVQVNGISVPVDVCYQEAPPRVCFELGAGEQEIFLFK